MEQSLNAGTRPKPLFAKMLHALLLVIFLAEVGMMALFLSFLLLTRGDLAAITAGMVAEPEVHALLWFLIVSVGLLLLVIGQRFSSVRVRPWGIPLNSVWCNFRICFKSIARFLSKRLLYVCLHS